MICGTLRVPPSLPDSWIVSSLLEDGPATSYTMPWLVESEICSQGPMQSVDLHTFAHMCKARHIQSRMFHAAKTLTREGIQQYCITFVVVIEEWADFFEIYTHRWEYLAAIRNRSEKSLTCVSLQPSGNRRVS
jgi:hypothetical protein